MLEAQQECHLAMGQLVARARQAARSTSSQKQPNAAGFSTAGHSEYLLNSQRGVLADALTWGNSTGFRVGQPESALHSTWSSGAHCLVNGRARTPLPSAPFPSTHPRP